ncbi:MAG: type IV pilus twitching motility protein PilT [Nitrospinota bacterium]|nr:MAG: type IV pilus twitching motility protein PilT [Nitrospinota bacterium]
MAKIDMLLKQAKEMGASDLHIRAGLSPLVRIHGELHPLSEARLSPEVCQEMLGEIMSPEQQRMFQEQGECDFAYAIPGIGRFRTNLFQQQYGIGGVFRIIPDRVLSLAELHLPKGLARFAHLEKGLIVVTGPTGSGKTTTLAALIDLINEERRCHILTIEDPLEFLHQNKKALITHREVGSHTRSFAQALRSALREDPDVILIGEMRDLETISLALTAAETGHLVLATLHTTTAAATVDRIVDVFPATQQEQVRTVLAEVLKGVICQQLLRRADGKGRIAALEILVATPALANLIREGKTFQIPSIIQTGKREGMQTMDQAIAELLRQKLITPEEAYAKAIDKETFQRYLGSASFFRRQ